MKNLLTVLAISLLTLGITGCDLVDVLDDTPPHNLVPDNVVTDAQSAENALRGIYSIWGMRAYNFNYRIEGIPALMSPYADGPAFLSPLIDHDLGELPTNAEVTGLWTALYYIINSSNQVIDLVGNLDDADGFSGDRRAEIIAEARFLRAMAHFDVLRYFGRFYDNGSPYGVIIRDEPSNYTTRVKERASVQASYEFILADLDHAIGNAPNFSVTYRASTTAAKALKARVLLYMGANTEAAALAREVIDEGTRGLEDTFESAFTQGLNSSEMILMRYTDATTFANDGKDVFYRLGRAVPSDAVKALMDDDPRSDFTYDATRILKVNHHPTYTPTYFIRLPEMYLIEAEALARSGAPVAEAKEPLDVVRMRAGLEPSTATNAGELLEDVFEEIVRELVYENGHEWTALIRFGKVEELTPSVVSEDQYILPLPREAELFANPAAEQNPGYN